MSTRLENPTINGDDLLRRLIDLGKVGRDAKGRLSRLAATDADKKGRDLVVRWMKDLGLQVRIDRIGNILGVWDVASANAPLMFGSHIDTVIDSGIYDGCYGVIAGLSVIQAVKESGVKTDRSLAVAVFTNEEGVRYAPDMMGSLVYAGGLDIDVALATIGTDDSVLGVELDRIRYAGTEQPGEIVPSAFIEVHIEQGPVLEAEGIPIGAVENLQGISWQKLVINGVANHAGTTPMRLRTDAGLAAARIATFLDDYCQHSNTVATIGTIRFEPNAINVIPSRAELTVDLRDPDNDALSAAEMALQKYVRSLEERDGVTIDSEQLVRLDPVLFDDAIVRLIEEVAENIGIQCTRMTSGAGHDAQMMSRICPTAMIFVPSKHGISHNPKEHTEPAHLIAGAQVLLGATLKLTAGVKSTHYAFFEP